MYISQWSGLLVAVLFAGATLAQEVAPAEFSPAEFSPDSTAVSEGEQYPAEILASRAALDDLLGGGGTTEDFEGFIIGNGQALVLDVNSLDENTMSYGQGPGLVQDGAAYSTASPAKLAWCGSGYYNLPTKSLGNSSNNQPLTIRYDSPVQAMGIDLHELNGYPDTVIFQVFDPAGALVGSANIVVPGTGQPLFVGFRYDQGIGSVRLDNGYYPWAPVIDNHTFGQLGCPGDPCNGGETLSAKTRIRDCGCQVQALLKGCTPGNDYGFMMPDGACVTGRANSRGKAKAKQCPSTSGAVRVSACGLEATVACP